MSDWTCLFEAVNWTGTMFLVALLVIVGWLLGPLWWVALIVGVIGGLMNLEESRPGQTDQVVGRFLRD